MAKLKTLCLIGGGAHWFEKCGEILMDFLGKCEHIEPTLTEDREVLASGDLKSYDALVVYTQGGELTDAQEQGLVDFVANGGGFVGIHCASDSFVKNKKYMDLVGGRFTGHGPTMDFPVTLTDVDHLITRRMKNFTIFDELYILADFDPSKVKVLAVAQWNHVNQPMVYVKDYGKGKMMYSALGHGPEAFAHPDFQKLIIRGIRWTCGLEEKKTINCGIVGYGGAFNMGKLHATSMEKAGMNLVAVSDIDPIRTKQAKDDFPDIKVFNKPSEMAAMKGLDLAVIITPHDSHAPLAVEFANHGKHVVTEKPFCITAQEATDIIEGAKKNKVMASVFHNRRWDGDYVAIKEVIEKGLIGDVFHIEAFMGHYGTPGSWWRSIKKISGGAFYDWGAHIVDWTLGLIPHKITSISGYFQDNLVWHGITNEDHVEAMVRFENGATANIQLSSIAHITKPRWRILGTKGAIEDHWGDQKFRLVSNVDGVLLNSEVRYRESDWDAYYRNVADHLYLDEPLVVTPESARRVIGVIETAEKSSKSGKEEKPNWAE